MKKCAWMILAMASLSPAMAQSLNERPSAPMAAAPDRAAPEGAGQPASTSASSGVRTSVPPTVNAALQGWSLFVVTPPPPRTYNKNDIVEIIINETSNQKSEQSLDTKKDYSTAAE